MKTMLSIRKEIDTSRQMFLKMETDNFLQHFRYITEVNPLPSIRNSQNKQNPCTKV